MERTWDTIPKWLAAVGGAIAGAFGGWTVTTTVLVAAMAADYLSGLAVAGMGKSPKTEGGGLSSKVGWNGLLRKGMMMLVVLIAATLIPPWETPMLSGRPRAGFTSRTKVCRCLRILHWQVCLSRVKSKNCSSRPRIRTANRPMWRHETMSPDTIMSGSGAVLLYRVVAEKLESSYFALCV